MHVFTASFNFSNNNAQLTTLNSVADVVVKGSFHGAWSTEKGANAAILESGCTRVLSDSFRPRHAEFATASIRVAPYWDEI